MPLTPERFRHTMGHLAGAVTVVTVRDAKGTPHGMTASAVTSLSLAPPMLLVCIDHEAVIHDVIVKAPIFGVNVLAAGQEAEARRYAERDRHAITSAGPNSPAGLPLVPGALAHIDCARAGVHQGGDHSIVMGTVEWADTREGSPLFYFRSEYRSLTL